MRSTRASPRTAEIPPHKIRSERCKIEARARGAVCAHTIYARDRRTPFSPMIVPQRPPLLEAEPAATGGVTPPSACGQSTYAPHSQHLRVSPAVGLTRRVVTARHVPSSVTWTPGTISMSDMSRTKTYACEFAPSGQAETPLFIRPRQAYRDTVFEVLFGFGAECADFSCQRVIAVVAGDNFGVAAAR